MKELIQLNVPLHEKNWFGTGGKARYFAEPCTPEEFCQALSFAEKEKIELVVIGEGANLLISDEGFNGIVIKPCMKDIIIHDHFITAGSGVCFDSLIEKSLEHHLIGIEEFSGIPGSVGGAVYMNIHYFEFLLGMFVERGTVIDRQGCIKEVDASWFNFSYNYSALHEKKDFLLDITFRLTKADEVQTAFARGRRQEIIRHRRRKYPYQRTCGSFFRSFSETEMKKITAQPKLPFVGYYLDALGAKGRIGYGLAKVSHQHANMIVTQPGATSGEVIELARILQTMVYKSYGIFPQPECQFIGFSTPPLFEQATD